MSDPALVGTIIVLVIACIPAGLLALPVIAVIIRVRSLEGVVDTMLKTQVNTLDLIPERLHERLGKSEQWIEAHEALARHIAAQSQHRRNEGGLQ
jgi:hypothetical protein